MTEKLNQIGIGKHSDEDAIRISEDDLAALSQYLGTKHYLTGFKATKVNIKIDLFAKNSFR